MCPVILPGAVMLLLAFETINQKYNQTFNERMRSKPYMAHFLNFTECIHAMYIQLLLWALAG